ncbi:MAG: site-specific integrase, partial [Nitrosotalea sp.]
MSSFLSKKRTKEGYLEKISSEPAATRRNRLSAIINFERFVSEKYGGRNAEQICDELSILQGQEKENALYDMLQDWINWNQQERKNTSTVRLMFASLRKFLYHKGIKTHPQDVKENLKFGKITNEERHPLSDDEYRAIVNAFSKSPRRQALYLSLGSSGMRIGEATRLRKKDLNFSQERIEVNIPANITKTRKGRSTYISKEAASRLKPILDKLNPEDLIFTKEHDDPLNAAIIEQKILTMALDRLGLNDRYSSNNFRKITSHSFRSYFFTKAARKHGENYAHKLVGHSGYLMQYDRMTGEEKLKMYLELEPDLMIFDQTKNEVEISKLREENQAIKELREEVKKLRESQA